MATPTHKKEQHVLQLTVSTLHQLLTLKTTYDIQIHMADRHARDFREFEAAAAVNNDLQGAGVLATPDKVARVLGYSEESFLIDDVDLGAHELGAYINAFPIKAAAASYVFTIVEVFGDDVAQIVSPGTIDRNKAWHDGVRGHADLRDPVQIKTAREAFGRHLGATFDQVPELAAQRLVKLKKLRNEFAHEGSTFINFDDYFRDAIAIVCQVAFLTTSEDRLSVYPWEDHFDKFEPQTRV